MRFSDFISRAAIRTNLPPQEKPQMVRQLVEALADSQAIHREDVDAVARAVLERETKGSTGLGRGIALPHALSPAVSRQVGSVAVCPAGADFAALDGDKTELFFVLVSPAEQSHVHLETLQHIAQQLRNDTFCKFLKQSRTPDAVWEVLEEVDLQHAVL